MNRIIRIVEPSLAIFFALTVFVFFGFYYQYHLHYQEQLQLFQSDLDYFIQNLQIPGGVINYLGEFLTQFYYYPLIGAGIIALLLLSVQQLIKKIVFAKNIENPFVLMSFIPSIVYLALLCDSNYYLSGLIGMLLALIFLRIYQLIDKKTTRIIFFPLFIILLYFIAGGIYFVFTVSIVSIELIRKLSKSSAVTIWSLGLNILLAFILPLIVRNFMITGPWLQSYLTEYYYKFRIIFPMPLIILWIIIPAFLLIFNILPNNFNKSKSIGIVIVLIISMGIGSYYILKSFSNFAEENEMAYDYFVRFEKWDEIIDKAEKSKPEDKNSMVAVNLALVMRSQLSEKMFQFKQNPDFLFIHYDKHGMVSHIASDVYYHLGFINYSQMAGFESNESSIDAKNSVRSFKRMAETSLINGQYRQAEKYLKYLSKSLFYRSWAKETMKYLYNDRKIENHPVWGLKRKLKPKTDYFLNKDRMNLILLRSLIDNPESRIAYEYLMAWYLLKKDFDGFLRYFSQMNAYQYNKVPLAWQEALVYIFTLSPEINEQLKDVQIDNTVKENIRNYATLYSQGKDKAQKLLESDFGNTYWYYLHFTQLPSDTLKVETPKNRE